MSCTVLIHGLWMKSPVMWPLGRRLQSAGFEIRYFDYATRGDFKDSVTALARFIETLEREEINLVGHSMGGLLALTAAHELPAQRGKIVAIGSPVRGSAVSRWLAEFQVGKTLLGGAALALHRATPINLPPTNWRCGVIAGTFGVGLGLVGARQLPFPHDGAVGVSETILEGAAHTTLAASHTGLLFSQEASTRTIRFLRAGVFTADSPGAQDRLVRT